MKMKSSVSYPLNSTRNETWTDVEVTSRAIVTLECPHSLLMAVEKEAEKRK